MNGVGGEPDVLGDDDDDDDGSGLVWSKVRQKVTLGRVPLTLQKSPLGCLLQQIWASYDNARVPTYYKNPNLKI